MTPEQLATIKQNAQRLLDPSDSFELIAYLDQLERECKVRRWLQETSVTFREFQHRNRERCESPSGFGHPVAYDEPRWPLQNWALAIAGEAGELCNLVKKCLRGDYSIERDEVRAALLAELADVITYCDLAISSLGADTGEVVVAKWDKVSRRIGYAALAPSEQEVQ